MKIGLSKKNILGVDVTDALKDDILKYITKSLEGREDKYYIVTPNPEMIVSAKQNPSFRLILNQARIALPDGVGITIAASFLGKKLKERISGTDFMELLCKEAATPLRQGFEGRRNPITVGFLGGKDGVAEKTAECLIQKYPGLNVSFVGEEWGEEGFDRAEKKYEVRSMKYENEKNRTTRDSPRGEAGQRPKTCLLASLRSGPASMAIDIIFVAFGFPKQEEWMAEHVGKIPVSIMMGVGGAFDYLSGNVPRAPRFLRTIGLEWLYRLIRQPWRFRRQGALIQFVFLVLATLLNDPDKYRET